MTTISSLSISKHHMLSFLCFILTFDAAANSPAYDFNSYMPTLKQHHSLPENDPAHTVIDSGYTISFDKIAVGIDGQPIGDYDFVYQQRTLDNRAIPVIKSAILFWAKIHWEESSIMPNDLKSMAILRI